MSHGPFNFAANGMLLIGLGPSTRYANQLRSCDADSGSGSSWVVATSLGRACARPPDRGGQFGGYQRVAAEVEKRVVHADPIVTKQAGKQCGDAAFGRGGGIAVL